MQWWFSHREQDQKDINPITTAVPHTLNSASRKVSIGAPFVLSRMKGIPQNPNSTDSTVMTVFLIQAHTSNGMEGCK
ncbi:unnamed protein product [Brassica oleracea]